MSETITRNTQKRLNAHRGPKTLATVGAMLCALSAVGCSGEADNSQHASETLPQYMTPTILEPTTSEVRQQLIFNALAGSGVPIIQVYPGASIAEQDKISNGTYNSGDIVTALCKTTGRVVHSHPEFGEEKRQSDQWIKIDGTPGETQFATAVYVENPSKLLAQLPSC